jgi:hypothetical protein
LHGQICYPDPDHHIAVDSVYPHKSPLAKEAAEVVEREVSLALEEVSVAVDNVHNNRKDQSVLLIHVSLLKRTRAAADNVVVVAAAVDVDDVDDVVVVDDHDDDDDHHHP